MKHLILILFLFPVYLFAQPQLQLGGGYSFTHLPSTAAGRLTDNAAWSSGISLDVECWLPWKKKSHPFGTFLRYGRVFSSRLEADFRGQAAGSLPDSERTIFARTNLQRISCGQVGLMIKVARFQAPRFEYSIMVNGGLNFILHQQIHIAASEFHQGDERLKQPTTGYEISTDSRIQENASLPNGVSLPDGMLVRAILFIETGLDIAASEGISSYFLIQVGLRPIIDTGLYQDDLQSKLWVQFRSGVKGRLF